MTKQSIQNILSGNNIIAQHVWFKQMFHCGLVKTNLMTFIM